MTESKVDCVVNGDIQGLARLKDFGTHWSATIDLATDGKTCLTLDRNKMPLRLADGTMDQAPYVDVRLEDGREGRAILMRMWGEEFRSGRGNPDAVMRSKPGSEYWSIEVFSQTLLTLPSQSELSPEMVD